MKKKRTHMSDMGEFSPGPTDLESLVELLAYVHLLYTQRTVVRENPQMPDAIC